MKLQELRHRLNELARVNPAADKQEAYVIITLCECGEPAKEGRFVITGVKRKRRKDLLEANYDGQATEINIHQNESLRDWETD